MVRLQSVKYVWSVICFMIQLVFQFSKPRFHVENILKDFIINFIFSMRNFKCSFKRIENMNPLKLQMSHLWINAKIQQKFNHALVKSLPN